MWALRNAFDLKNHPHRTGTSILVVIVDAIPAALSGVEQDPPRMFKLREATLMEKRQLAIFNPQSAVLVATSDSQDAQTSTPANLLLVFCTGVAINLISNMDLIPDGPDAVKDWKSVLIQSTQLK